MSSSGVNFGVKLLTEFFEISELIDPLTNLSGKYPNGQKGPKLKPLDPKRIQAIKNQVLSTLNPGENKEQFWKATRKAICKKISFLKRTNNIENIGDE